MFEIVELDPATEDGDEIELITTGTMAQMEIQLASLLSDIADEWDTYGAGWATYRIQPAS